MRLLAAACISRVAGAFLAQIDDGDVIMTATEEQISSEETPQNSNAKPTQEVAVEKWGQAVMDLGFCVVPSLLLRAQPRLNLSPTYLAVASATSGAARAVSLIHIRKHGTWS